MAESPEQGDAMRDPRHRNRWCDTSSIAAYLDDYAGRLRAALLTVDSDALDRARTVVEAAAKRGNRIYSAGNGGSAAIADHLCCDFAKGTNAAGHPPIDSSALTANMPLYSAIANDFGFEHVFATQLEIAGREGDVLIAISSSGNSPNIVRALEAAKAAGMTSIGLSGFSGGKLREQADISLHIDDPNYGIVEDCHQSLMHIMAQFIACGRDQGAA